MHILPRMPTTGSGKILKTELRQMFGGAAGAAASTAAAAQAAALAPAAGLAEAAEVAAALCGAGVACHALDAGLGFEWGRELLPNMSYVLAVERAADIQAQVGAATVFGIDAAA